jgi:hypothetical protein
MVGHCLPFSGSRQWLVFEAAEYNRAVAHNWTGQHRATWGPWTAFAANSNARTAYANSECRVSIGGSGSSISIVSSAIGHLRKIAAGFFQHPGRCHEGRLATPRNSNFCGKKI